MYSEGAGQFLLAHIDRSLPEHAAVTPDISQSDFNPQRRMTEI